jgi:DNA modification methylase
MVEEVKEDDYEEPEDLETTVVLGDVYQLGEHRLMCGDSTKIEDVEKLMNGEKADMVFTDPPYGMKKENEGVINDNLNYDDLLEFNKEWIPLSFMMLKDVGSWYCWGTDEPLMDIYSEIIKPYIKDNKATFRNLITWDKGNGQGQLSEEFRMYPIADEKCLFIMMGVQGFNTNADNYYEAWESIRSYLDGEKRKMGWTDKWIAEQMGIDPRLHWFGKSQWDLPTEEKYKQLQKLANDSAFKKEYSEIKKEYSEIKKEYYATRAYFNNTHDNMNNVWHFERDRDNDHATPKPIALCSRAIKSSSRDEEMVLDLFGGSGSTLIACEQTNRKCYMMEIDPYYCQVIIDRWEKFTGKEAIKLE